MDALYWKEPSSLVLEQLRMPLHAGGGTKEDDSKAFLCV